MRVNYKTCIAGDKCVLVPYRPQHVATYHEWMKDPDLLDATGSEPLTLKEEVEMQQSWKNDPDKCTFIVLARKECTEIQTKDDFVEQNLNAMVGDVNLFLSLQEDDEVESDTDNEPTVEETEQSTTTKPLQAELDIMIAEHSARGNGMGREASCLMMLYGAQTLNICRYYCKIKETNLASRNLFESLGFVQCNYAECFCEVELELKRETPQEVADVLLKHVGHFTMKQWQCPVPPQESLLDNEDQ